MRKLIPAFLFLATAALAQTDTPRIIKYPAKKALTHELLWTMPRVSNPVPSPDGKWVVFNVNKPSYDEKVASSDLWIVAADGSAPARQLTATKSGESDVAWSHDSRRIAFSAKREGDEKEQIYVMNVGGGEAERVTNLTNGARAPQFRPDDKAILFTSSVYPGAKTEEDNKRIAKERKELKYHVRTYTSFPIRSWDHWLDDLAPHVFYQEFDYGAQPHDVLAASKMVDEPGFAGRGGGEGGTESLDATWAPDGETIVFAATTKRNVAAYAEVPHSLYRIVANSNAEPELIAQGDSYGRPRFGADGTTLYTIFEPNNGKIYNLARLVRYDWPSMTNRKVVTAAPFDRSVGSFAITPDNKSVYFTAEEAGLEKVYRVPADGSAQPEEAVKQERGVFTRLAIADRAPVIVAMWGSSINPAEVVRIDPEKQLPSLLTNITFNAASGIDWLKPEHFWFTSKRGKKIHNMIVKPAAFDPTKKYPLFVVIHGGPASMWRDDISLRWNYHLLAKPGYIVLLTDYTGSTGFGEKFAQEITGDPLKGPGDEINEAADEAIKRFPFIDGTRQAAGGASYGGHLANWLEATTTRYKCLISHAGLINLESQWGTSDGIYHREIMNGGPVWEQGKVWREQNPIRYMAHFKTPMLLSVGERDFRVPINETLENWSALQRMRVPSRLLVWPNANHWVLDPNDSKQWYSEVWGWLATWLTPGSAETASAPPATPHR